MRLSFVGIWFLCFSLTYASCSNTSAFPELSEADLSELQEGLQQGQFTSVDLVKAYLARIQEVNTALHAVAETNPDALTIAQTLDEERKAAGSYALLGSKVPHDSTVVAKLRAAGAIILGKANLSQWANARSSNTTNGWSAYGGQCSAVYYPNQDPSGSSSGSAVISSIGLAFATLGTDTIGSVLSPSDVNNVVGIRPTVGLTSRHLVIPFSLRQDSVGPLARTVKDAAAMLSVIAGPDPADNYTTVNPHPDLDYTKFDEDYNTTLKNGRIGIPANILEVFTASWFDTTNTSGPVMDAFYAAVNLLEQHGATVNHNANYSRLDEYITGYLDGSISNVVLADVAYDIPEYLNLLQPQATPLPQTLEDIRNFTQHYPLEDYPDRDTADFDMELAAPSASSAEIWAQYQLNLQLGGAGGIVGALDNNNLDVLIVPTQASPYVTCIAGLPAISVPLGFYPSSQPVLESSRGLIGTAPGIPFGISFIGRAWSEQTLLKYAYAFEQLTQVRKSGKPYMLPSTELGDIVG
ncbi:hypothetical protein BP6252_13201 [Coleophoma cylindrospora]|uniref:Amidase domain-containing protein n=1 Tax=Coleophoma cylindrospora TaxID=1849047 RepID=A0A3D8QA60_9HELO|nr:hypothetical protein BP6252_13201 [Coleophoma cylindrospora]